MLKFCEKIKKFINKKFGRKFNDPIRGRSKRIGRFRRERIAKQEQLSGDRAIINERKALR